MKPTYGQRRAAGFKAKKIGELWEDLFYRACLKRGIAITRIPDGCKQIGQNKIIRVGTPFDWVLTHNNVTALIDTKTTATDSITASSIRSNQLDALLSHARQGCVTGYVVWFREPDLISFVPAHILLDHVRSRKGIKHTTDGLIPLGASALIDAYNIFDHTNGKHEKDLEPNGSKKTD